MLGNYFKTAWRGLVKSRIYLMINVLGLAAGMAVALLIAFWIWDELSFDHYHKNHKQLAQVMTTFIHTEGDMETGPSVAMPLGNELRTKYGGAFKNVSMTSWNSEHVLSIEDKKIAASGMWVESNFPAMFTLEMQEGNSNALRDPSALLLSASVAKALFGNASPINKTVKLDNNDSYTVAGVYEDLPRNTTLTDTKILLPWGKYITADDMAKQAATHWGFHSWQCFVQLNEPADFSKVAAKIRKASMAHIDVAKDSPEELTLLSADDWHLRSAFKNGKQSGGRIQYVWMFGIIGSFVLLLACINFMNLSTARSEKRAKEVGIRKAIGSQRKQLVNQFLSESFLVTLIAMLIALLLAQCSLNFFNTLSGKQISIPWADGWFWILLLLFAIFTSLVAGSYPAFYLSRFRPVRALKGTFRLGKSASLPRKVLVVVQFTVSITLIIGTTIVYKQIQFAKDRPVGYTRQGLLTINNTRELSEHYDALRNDLLNTGVIANVATATSPSTDLKDTRTGFNWAGKDPNAVPVLGLVGVSEDFGNTIGWQVKAGRNFSRDFKADTSAFILNEAAAKLTGIKNIVGKIITKDSVPFTVVGVVKDLVMESPYQPTKPTVFLMTTFSRMIVIRVKSNMAMASALPKIETIFKRYDPDVPFDYKFVDDEYAQKFSDEQRIGHLAAFFAGLAIFISCLGLFGLAAFVAEQRTKEIGVRKVLGASIFNLWGMLSAEFLRLVIIASVIAIPIAWWEMDRWLQSFAYRAPVSGWVFAVAGFMALSIALITVSFQAIKAAIANPVKALRSE